ncbi:hypothetical protein D3C76_1527700 [compost metagenome]
MIDVASPSSLVAKENTNGLAVKLPVALELSPSVFPPDNDCARVWRNSPLAPAAEPFDCAPVV